MKIKEPLIPLKDGQFLHQLSDYDILKKYSAACWMFTLSTLKRACHFLRDKSEIQLGTMSRDMYSAISLVIIYLYIFEYRKTQGGKILLVSNFYRIILVYCAIKTIRREIKIL